MNNPHHNKPHLIQVSQAGQYFVTVRFTAQISGHLRVEGIARSTAQK